MAGAKQLNVLTGRKYRGLDRQLLVKTESEQLFLECVMALWTEGMTIFETVVGQGLSQVNTGFLVGHIGVLE